MGCSSAQRLQNKIRCSRQRRQRNQRYFTECIEAWYCRHHEYVAVVKDFVIVIEDKADLDKHQKLTDTEILSINQKGIADYAVNGACFYAKHIAQNSSFHKNFAIGVSGILLALDD